MEVEWLVVSRVEREDNRTLIYGGREDYHLIGTVNCEVEVGQFAPYEPAGMNFGWLIETPLDEEETECPD